MFDAARAEQLPVAAEGFADRAYHPDGRLVNRSEPGAVIHEPQDILARALQMVREGTVTCIDGSQLSLVADTICVPSVTTPIKAKPIDPPTLSVTFRINDGPLAGREGDKVQSRVIRDRLMREAEGNVAIRVTPGTDGDSFDVAGRGELQLAVLIENMRREGFELTIGRPKVLFKEEAGQTLEPFRFLTIRAEPLMERQRIETRQPRLESGLAIRIPEEPRITQARGDDALGVGGDPAIVGGLRIRHRQERRHQRAVGTDNREEVLMVD